jgi:NTE family protein
MGFTLALGGGGAKGAAHIPVFEALDDLGLKPSAITGTSIGALMGAAYAAGFSGADLREHVTALSGRKAKSIWALLRDPRTTGGLLGAGAAYDVVVPEGMPETIEDLGIPMTIVATDFYAHESLHLREGPLAEAVAASIAIPGIFAPVEIGGRTLVDGGMTQNLPLRAAPEGPVLAVDVMDYPAPGETLGRFKLAVGAFQIMVKSTIREDLKMRPPTLLIDPDTGGVGPLDFYRMPEILETASAGAEDIKRRIAEAFDTV